PPHRRPHNRAPHSPAPAGPTAPATLPAPALLGSERPWLLTILFTPLTLDVILDLRAGRLSRLAWVLPAVYVLWANSHIQFVYGLLLLALACAAPVLDRLLGRAGPVDTPGWRRLALLTGLCALATLVNPYHLRLY